MSAINWDGEEMEIAITCTLYNNKKMKIYVSKYDIFTTKKFDKKTIFFNEFLPVFGMKNLKYKKCKRVLLFDLSPVDDIFQTVTSQKFHRKVLIYKYCMGFCKVETGKSISIEGSVSPYFYINCERGGIIKPQLLDKYFLRVSVSSELKMMLRDYIKGGDFLQMKFRSKFEEISKRENISLCEFFNPMLSKIKKFVK